MDSMTFALHKKEKKQLDAIAHEFSIKEKKKITNGELVRRAIREVYGVTPEGKQKKAGKSNGKRRKKRGRDA
jgi:uncharacterized protein YdaU (DUF1376 family)